MKPRGETMAELVELLGVLGHPIGQVTAPDEAQTDVPEFPYLIVTPRDGSQFSGPPFHDPQADACHYFDVSCAGARADQAQGVTDAVVEVVIGRDGDGQLVHAWPSVEPMGRTVESISALDRSDDGRVQWAVVEVSIDTTDG